MAFPPTPEAAIIASVPFEIWHYISGFLPGNQLRRLYPVNHAFFRIALALRYREVTLSSADQSTGDSVSGKLTAAILKSPTLGEYVRSLVFKVDCCNAIHEIHQKPRDRALSARLPLPPPSKEAEVFMASLQHLTNLTVMWCSCPSHKISCDAYLNMLSLGRLTFFSSLCSLSLTLALDSIPSLFTVSFHFPQLDQLELDLLKDESSTDSVIYSTLIPFIRDHATTLQALSIRMFAQDDHLKFYGALGHLPNLRKFRFTGPYIDRSLPARNLAFEKFLSLHSATLTDLNWNPGGGYQSPPFSVRLPMLRVLKLTFSVDGRHRLLEFQRTLSYLHDHPQPLTSFSVLNTSLLDIEIRGLLRVRAVLQLRNLELSLKVLDKSFLSAIVDALPNLERFVAVFDRFNLRTVEFSDGSLKHWSVFDLVLELEQPADFNFIGMWGKLILDSFPRVEFLNGMYREDLLKLVSRGGS